MKLTILFVFALAAVPAAAGAQDTPSFEELAGAAQQAQRQNDLSTAVLRYKEALKMRPDIPELHANLGLVDYQMGDAADARQEFETALHLKPSLFVPNLFLGLDSLKRDEPASALRYLSRAAQLNPRDLQVNLSLGRAFAALNRDSEAIAAYSNAVAVQPGNEDGWYGLGTSYLDRAESLSDLLAKRYRDSSSFRALTASYFDDQGKYERAASEYNAVVSSADAPACSHTQYGFTLIHDSKFTQAADEFNADEQSRNCAALAAIGLARLQMNNGNAPAAAALLVHAAKDHPEEFGANAFEFWKDLPAEKAAAFEHELDQGALDQGAGAIVKKDLQDALRGDRSGDFAEPGSSEPGDPGQAFLSGHYRTAAALTEKSIASGTASPAALYWAVRANQHLAASALTQAVAVAPASIRIHLLLGDLYRRKGQYQAGRQEFQAALELDKNNVPALLGLAATLYLNGDAASAEQAASQALSLQPNDPETRLLMAEVLVAQHRYDEAYKYVDPVPNGKPDLLAEVHGMRGKILAATNHPTEAVAELKQAVSHDPQGDLTYVLARQYQVLGDKQSAAAAFQRSNTLRQKFNERANYKFEDRAQN